jgi:hypothetical protein
MPHDGLPDGVDRTSRMASCRHISERLPGALLGARYEPRAAKGDLVAFPRASPITLCTAFRVAFTYRKLCKPELRNGSPGAGVGINVGSASCRILVRFVYDSSGRHT